MDRSGKDPKHQLAVNAKVNSETPLADPSYSYDCLLPSHIRLISIDPGVVDEPLRCTIKSFPPEGHPSYVALSYVWGDPDDRAPIVLNDREISIGRNLCYALLQYRDWQVSNAFEPLVENATALWIWADALCINQDDVDEKSREIERIGEIFSSASLVVCWLGLRENEDKGTLQHLIESARKAHRVAAEDGDYATNYKPEVEKLLSSMVKDQREKLKQLIEGILARPWFERVWIIQEFAVAEVPIFALGDWYCDSDMLVEFMREVQCLRSESEGWHNLVLPSVSGVYRNRYRSERGKTRVWGSESERAKGTAKGFLKEAQRSLTSSTSATEVLDTAPRSSKQTESTRHRDLQASHQHPAVDVNTANAEPIDVTTPKLFASEILQFLRLSWTHKSTVPHDKIYAGLGLLKDFDWARHFPMLAPNYAKPFSLVYQQYTAFIMQHAMDISLLDFGPLRRAHYHDGVAIPSWVPDIPSGAVLNSPDTRSAVRVIFDQNQAELQLEGFKLCELSFALNIDKSLSWKEKAAIFERSILRPSSELLQKGLFEVTQQYLKYFVQDPTLITKASAQVMSLKDNEETCFLVNIVEHIEDQHIQGPPLEGTLSRKISDRVFLGSDGKIFRSIHRRARSLCPGDVVYHLKGLDHLALLRPYGSAFEFLGCCKLIVKSPSYDVDALFWTLLDGEWITII